LPGHFRRRATFIPYPPSIVSNTTQQRLDAFRQQRRVQAGSLIITAFGDAILPRGGRIWLGSLIRLLEPLELNERLIRTSVFRLAKEEWLRTETIGRRADYVLTPSGRRRFEEASRHIYAGQAPLWDRRWRLILVVGELEPKLREQLRGALFWQGFGALGADCFVHPSAELPSVLDALIAEGRPPRWAPCCRCSPPIRARPCRPAMLTWSAGPGISAPWPMPTASSSPSTSPFLMNCAATTWPA